VKGNVDCNVCSYKAPAVVWSRCLAPSYKQIT